ncbi:hypothetical protein [Mucilaginibacter flavus]|uniref:hypothetical protein n=1 Tax=Mucilaginibacter flavus TaxID=931504 RepID=UPI0025B54091|nr:hypothetical protein [Mucilaginibacter flavus]MDN3581914.1 hypothetical protein [Mucilaginibacter flavus]
MRYSTRCLSLLFLHIILIFSSCYKSSTINNNPKLKNDFQVIDSLMIAGNSDTAKKMLDATRGKLDKSNPLIVYYYRMKADGYYHNRPLMIRYADSAIAFFNNNNLAEKYPDAYLQALIIKGDISMVLKQYNLALRYYAKGKLLLSDGSCDDGILDTKIAGIYYSQKNYLLAAQYWKLDYQRLGACTTRTQQKLFYLRQAALNSIGVAYERAGITDSAAYYYKRIWH